MIIKQSIEAGGSLDNSTCVVIGLKNLKSMLKPRTIEFQNYLKKSYCPMKNLIKYTNFEDIRKSIFNYKESNIKIKNDEKFNFLNINYVNIIEEERPLTTNNNYIKRVFSKENTEKILMNTIESKDLRTEESYNITTKQNEPKTPIIVRHIDKRNNTTESNKSKILGIKSRNFSSSNEFVKFGYDKKIHLKEPNNDNKNDNRGNTSPKNLTEKGFEKGFSPFKPLSHMKFQDNFLKTASNGFSPLKTSFSKSFPLKPSSPKISKFKEMKPLPKIKKENNNNTKFEKFGIYNFTKTMPSNKNSNWRGIIGNVNTVNLNLKNTPSKMDNIKSIFQVYNLN